MTGFIHNASVHVARNISDLNSLSSYPKGQNITDVSIFTAYSQNTPFEDGFLVSLIWRNIDNARNFIHQFAIEDNTTTVKHRAYNNTAGWSSWTTLGGNKKVILQRSVARWAA